MQMENGKMDDYISRQAALDAMENCEPGEEPFVIKNLPSADECTIITEYCRKRDLVLITMESFRVLQAYYDRQNGMGGD